METVLYIVIFHKCLNIDVILCKITCIFPDPKTFGLDILLRQLISHNVGNLFQFSFQKVRFTLFELQFGKTFFGNFRKLSNVNPKSENAVAMAAKIKIS